MKKALRLLMVVLFATTPVFAQTSGTVNKSSFTQTNETAYIAARTLDKVLVTVASAGGVLTLYNSTWTTSGVRVSSISLGTVMSYNFEDLAVRGIFYSLVTNANGVTILYK